MLTEKQLLVLKREIEEAKIAVSESRGHLSALMKQLNENWACPTVEKAEKRLAKMKSELETMLSEIEESSEKLEEKLEIQ